MSRLSTLERQLSQLKQRKKSLEQSLSTNRERKRDVESIRSKLQDVVDDSYGGINKYIDKICEDVGDAVTGSLLARNLDASVSASKESGSSVDGYVTSAMEDLEQEIRNVKKKIEQQENELSSVRRQIDNVNDEIWRERKREAEEALNNLLGG